MLRSYDSSIGITAIFTNEGKHGKLTDICLSPGTLVRETMDLKSFGIVVSNNEKSVAILWSKLTEYTELKIKFQSLRR